MEILTIISLIAGFAKYIPNLMTILKGCDLLLSTLWGIWHSHVPAKSPLTQKAVSSFKKVITALQDTHTVIQKHIAQQMPYQQPKPSQDLEPEKIDVIIQSDEFHTIEHPDTITVPDWLQKYGDQDNGNKETKTS